MHQQLKVLIMIIGVLVIGLAFAVTKETPLVDKITVNYGEPKKKEIAVNVTIHIPNFATAHRLIGLIGFPLSVLSTNGMSSFNFW